MLKAVQSLVDAITPDRCTICNKPLLGSYRVNKWGQKACVEHNLAFCTSCGRYVLPSDLRQMGVIHAQSVLERLCASQSI